MNNNDKNTVAVNKKIIFKKDDGGWYASNVPGSRSSNAMVQGADVMLEAVAHGKSTVEMVFSADIDDPAPYILETDLATHMPWGGYYTIKDGNAGRAPAFCGFLGMPVIYLCNQYEVFLGTDLARGEHSEKIFVHSIKAA